MSALSTQQINKYLTEAGKHFIEKTQAETCNETDCKDEATCSGFCELHFNQENCLHQNTEKMGAGMVRCLDCEKEYCPINEDSYERD